MRKGNAGSPMAVQAPGDFHYVVWVHDGRYAADFEFQNEYRRDWKSIVTVVSLRACALARATLRTWLWVLECPNLTYLDLSGNGLVDVSSGMLWQRLVNLRVLLLHDNKLDGREALEEIAVHTPHLVVLTLQGNKLATYRRWAMVAWPSLVLLDHYVIADTEKMLLDTPALPHHITSTRRPLANVYQPMSEWHLVNLDRTLPQCDPEKPTQAREIEVLASVSTFISHVMCVRSKMSPACMVQRVWRGRKVRRQWIEFVVSANEAERQRQRDLETDDEEERGDAAHKPIAPHVLRAIVTVQAKWKARVRQQRQVAAAVEEHRITDVFFLPSHTSTVEKILQAHSAQRVQLFHTTGYIVLRRHVASSKNAERRDVASMQLLNSGMVLKEDAFLREEVESMSVRASPRNNRRVSVTSPQYMRPNRHRGSRASVMFQSLRSGSSPRALVPPSALIPLSNTAAATAAAAAAATAAAPLTKPATQPRSKRYLEHVVPSKYLPALHREVLVRSMRYRETHDITLAMVRMSTASMTLFLKALRTHNAEASQSRITVYTRGDVRRLTASVAIQAAYRRYCVRKTYGRHLGDVPHKVFSATIVQAMFHRYVARRRRAFLVQLKAIVDDAAAGDGADGISVRGTELFLSFNAYRQITCALENRDNTKFGVPVYIPPDDELRRRQRKLQDEHGTPRPLMQVSATREQVLLASGLQLAAETPPSGECLVYAPHVLRELPRWLVRDGKLLNQEPADACYAEHAASDPAADSAAACDSSTRVLLGGSYPRRLDLLSLLFTGAQLPYAVVRSRTAFVKVLNNPTARMLPFFQRGYVCLRYGSRDEAVRRRVCLAALTYASRPGETGGSVLCFEHPRNMRLHDAAHAIQAWWFAARRFGGVGSRVAAVPSEPTSVPTRDADVATSVDDTPHGSASTTPLPGGSSSAPLRVLFHTTTLNNPIEGSGGLVASTIVEDTVRAQPTVTVLRAVQRPALPRTTRCAATPLAPRSASASATPAAGAAGRDLCLRPSSAADCSSLGLNVSRPTPPPPAAPPQEAAERERRQLLMERYQLREAVEARRKKDDLERRRMVDNRKEHLRRLWEVSRPGLLGATGGGGGGGELPASAVVLPSPKNRAETAAAAETAEGGGEEGGGGVPLSVGDTPSPAPPPPPPPPAAAVVVSASAAAPAVGGGGSRGAAAGVEGAAAAEESNAEVGGAGGECVSVSLTHLKLSAALQRFAEDVTDMERCRSAAATDSKLKPEYVVSSQDMRWMTAKELSTLSAAKTARECVQRKGDVAQKRYAALQARVLQQENKQAAHHERAMATESYRVACNASLARQWEGDRERCAAAAARRAAHQDRRSHTLTSRGTAAAFARYQNVLEKEEYQRTLHSLRSRFYGHVARSTYQKRLDTRATKARMQQHQDSDLKVKRAVAIYGSTVQRDAVRRRLEEEEALQRADRLAHQARRDANRANLLHKFEAVDAGETVAAAAASPSGRFAAVRLHDSELPPPPPRMQPQCLPEPPLPVQETTPAQQQQQQQQQQLLPPADDIIGAHSELVEFPAMPHPDTEPASERRRLTYDTAVPSKPLFTPPPPRRARSLGSVYHKRDAAPASAASARATSAAAAIGEAPRPPLTARPRTSNPRMSSAIDIPCIPAES